MGEFENLQTKKGGLGGAISTVKVQILDFLELMEPKYITVQELGKILAFFAEEKYKEGLELAQLYYQEKYLPKNPDSPKKLIDRFN